MRNLKLLAVLAIAAQGGAQGGARTLVISLADHKLAVVEDGRTVKVYPIAVGKPGTPSPIGSFQVISRVVKPTWYCPKQIVRPGPANPLGTRWMGLSVKGYGIHGTNAPDSIGTSASHGCVRMQNRDVEELFDLVEVGDTVDMVSEATGELAKIFGKKDGPVTTGISGGSQ